MIKLLSKRKKNSSHHKHKDWIKILAQGTEIAKSKVDIPEQIILTWDCITYDYTKIYSKCKASSFYGWVSEDDHEWPKHAGPYK